MRMRGCSGWVGIGFLLGMGMPQAVVGQLPVLDYKTKRMLTRSELGSSPEIRVGPDGSLVIANPAARLFHVQPQGKGAFETVNVGNIASSAFPFRFGWSEGRIWAIDWAQSEVIWFNADWTVRDRSELRRPDPEGIVRSSGLLGITAEGLRVFEGRTGPRAVAVSERGYLIDPDGVFVTLPIELPAPVADWPIWLSDPDGDIVDTLATIPAPRAVTFAYRDGTWQGPVRRARFQEFIHPYTDHPVFGMDPTGRHFVLVERAVVGDAERARYHTYHMTTSGDTVSTRAHPFRPIPISKDWVDAEMARIVKDLGEEAAEALRRGLEMPRWLPPVTKVVVGPDGSSWVRREAVPGAQHIVWDLLAPTGNRMGQVTLPAGLSVNAVAALTGWAIQESDGSLWRIDVEHRVDAMEATPDGRRPPVTSPLSPSARGSMAVMEVHALRMPGLSAMPLAQTGRE
jgi:hypothetical protein